MIVPVPETSPTVPKPLIVRAGIVDDAAAAGGAQGTALRG